MIPATLPPRATLDAHDPSTTPTVPSPRPCQVRALADLFHAADLAAEAAFRGRQGQPPHIVAEARTLHRRERAERLSRLCRHCGAPAVGRTGECQDCAIATASDAMEAPT